MVAYSFQVQFAAPIRAGTKRQTIRAVGRRVHATPGLPLQLFTGMRTKFCRRIGNAVCTDVLAVELEWRERRAVLLRWNGETEVIPPGAFDQFAQSDGFEDGDAMATFWERTHRDTAYPFIGRLIEWGDFVPAAADAA